MGVVASVGIDRSETAGIGVGVVRRGQDGVKLPAGKQKFVGSGRGDLPIRVPVYCGLGQSAGLQRGQMHTSAHLLNLLNRGL
jgi:hypothetical protein